MGATAGRSPTISKFADRGTHGQRITTLCLKLRRQEGLTADTKRLESGVISPHFMSTTFKVQDKEFVLTGDEEKDNEESLVEEEALEQGDTKV